MDFSDNRSAINGCWSSWSRQNQTQMWRRLWGVNDNCFLVNLNILDVRFQDSHGYEAGLSEKAKSSTVQFNCW